MLKSATYGVMRGPSAGRPGRPASRFGGLACIMFLCWPHMALCGDQVPAGLDDTHLALVANLLYSSRVVERVAFPPAYLRGLLRPFHIAFTILSRQGSAALPWGDPPTSLSRVSIFTSARAELL